MARGENTISIRIDLKSGVRVGPGKVALLEAIAETGSISAGARRMGMSYRKAWLLVDAFNNTFREPVISTETGGDHGGGAQLTDTGREIVKLYRQIETKTASATASSRDALDLLMRNAPARRSK